MRMFLILLLVSKAGISMAQKSAVLQGKWKFITVSQVFSTSRDSLYYNLETDSIYIPAKDLKEAHRDGLDSIQAADLFKSMYGHFKKSTLAFAKDSVVPESKTTRATGTYAISNNDTLDMHLGFDGKEQEHLACTFLLAGNLLTIKLRYDVGYSRFILKKE